MLLSKTYFRHSLQNIASISFKFLLCTGKLCPPLYIACNMTCLIYTLFFFKFVNKDIFLWLSFSFGYSVVLLELI